MYCFIENVGNLVCPASYDVGAHLNIVLVSIPEGNDKIAKYPVMFRQAGFWISYFTQDRILLTQYFWKDLLDYLEFRKERQLRRKEKLKRPKLVWIILRKGLNYQKELFGLSKF